MQGTQDSLCTGLDQGLNLSDEFSAGSSSGYMTNESSSSNRGDTQSDQTVLLQAFNDFIQDKKIVAREWRTIRQEESSCVAVADDSSFTRCKSCISSFRKFARMLFISRKQKPNRIRIEDLLDS